MMKSTFEFFAIASPASRVRGTRETNRRAPKLNRRMLMIVSTTTALDGTPVSEYVGVVTGEAVLGTNAFRDLFAGLRDIVGGRAEGCRRRGRGRRRLRVYPARSRWQHAHGQRLRDRSQAVATALPALRPRRCRGPWGIATKGVGPTRGKPWSEVARRTVLIP